MTEQKSVSLTINGIKWELIDNDGDILIQAGNKYYGVVVGFSDGKQFNLYPAAIKELGFNTKPTLAEALALIQG